MSLITTKLPSPTVADHLGLYQVPPASFPEFFVDKPDEKPKLHLVASAIVIHSNHVLLVQRAAHNFQPLLWEVPGGRCESKDKTVITSAVRELWEEAGLVASHVVDIVGEYGWLDCGQPWKKITFLVTVEHEKGDQDDRKPQVTIDPQEQESFIWATEKDVVANRCGNITLNWTSDQQRQTVLDAFALLKT